MIVYNVQVSGGEYEDHWSYIAECFVSKQLADEYVEKKKALHKKIEEKENEFNKLFGEFCNEIDADGKPYFNAYGGSFEDFIRKLESYKERNETIHTFLETYDRTFIRQMHEWFIGECMLGSKSCSCNISYNVIPMQVVTSMLEISEKI
jgi:hypothetical protein